MSSVSSSKNKNQPRDYVRAAGLIFGTVAIFLLGQLFGVVLLFSSLLAFGVSEDRVQTLLSDNVYVQFAAIALVELITIVLLVAATRYMKINFRRFFNLDVRPRKQYIALALVGYAFYLFCLFTIIPILTLLIPSLDTNQTQQLGFDSPQGWELLAVFASLVLLPALVEEMVFRGVLFRGLRRYIGIVWAAIVTSVIFGAAHLEFLGDGPLNWIAAVDTALLSLFLVAVYVRGKSLWPAIVLHALKNSVAFFMLFVLKSDDVWIIIAYWPAVAATVLLLAVRGLHSVRRPTA